MGENLDVEGRAAVRTPMQWSDEPGAGFSQAPPKRFPAAITEGLYGPDRINVAQQRRDPDSLLNWFERLIRRRRESPELALGNARLIATEPKGVFAHRCDWADHTVLAVHNLADESVLVTIPIESDREIHALDDLLQGGRIEVHGGAATVDLDPYGYRWFRVQYEGQRIVP